MGVTGSPSSNWTRGISRSARARLQRRFILSKGWMLFLIALLSVFTPPPSLRELQRADVCGMLWEAYIGTLEELPHTHILAQFEATYFGPVNMMRSAVPFLRRQRGGHIVNVTGLTGHMGTPGLSVRCAGDHAVEGFSDVCGFTSSQHAIAVDWR